MKLEMKDPQTGRQIEIGIPDWQLLTSIMSSAASFRSLASVHVLAAMIASPDFDTPREEGEDKTQAYARRAVEYAEALEGELQRRELASASARKDNTP